MRSGLVACFAGEIGSGKTSVTTMLARCLKWRRVGFGDYLRQELARRGGDSRGREELQELGQSLVHSDPVALCRAVLESGRFCAGDDLLVDGIRHVLVYTTLVDVVKPSRTRLFYLRANERIRSIRTTRRGDVIPASIGSHPVESELATRVFDMADVVVDAGGSFGDVIRCCVDGLREHGVDSELLAACVEYAERG